MIDVHSHILPDFDDGAKNTEVALAMLRESKKQGIDTVISTSHCYPRHSYVIDDFLHDRRLAFEELKAAMEESGEEPPEVRLGCELNLCRDISDDDRLPLLCAEGTPYLLLEMPYTPWSEWHVEAVYKMTLRDDIIPVMAHIDRFLDQNKNLLNQLFELDVLYQVNAESFLVKQMTKGLDMLFDTGRIHFLGSDMHNMGDRKPNIGAAAEKIIKNYGEDHLRYLEENNRRLAAGEEIDAFGARSLTKKTFFQRVFGKR